MISVFKQILLIALLFIVSIVSAQSVRSYERAGDDAFKKKDYGAAIQQYATILKRDAGNTAVLWKYAECARIFYAFPEAEKAYLKVADAKKQRKSYPLLSFRLGEVKKGEGDYTAAIGFFETFLAEKPKGQDAFMEQAGKEIESCRLAQSLTSVSPKVDIKHLGKEINSPFSDFAPVVVGDTLFFSSYRFDKKSDRSKPKGKITKVMISARGGRAREPGRGFPATDTAHIAHTAFSPDGHYVFFTICKNINASDIRCELWLTVIDRRNHWLPPVRLPEPVNKAGYTTTQPNIAYDQKAQGPVLWFASDRPGGQGKLDIWYLPLDTVFFCPCSLPLPGKKIPRLPKFGEPIHATAVNTPGNDGTPFFHAPTQELYFSSDGLPGLGGYDIFESKKTGDSLYMPVNLGSGINTSYNDLYFYLRPDGLNGYLSSNRPGSFYLDEGNKTCCNDLYSFTLPKPEKPPVVQNKDSIPTLVQKNPVPRSDTPFVQPIPDPPKLQDFVGLPLYFDNDEPDKRTNRTSTKKSYEESVEAYLARQAEYRDRFSKGLNGAAGDAAETLIDDFFENEVRRGYDRLGQLCDLLLTRLQKGEHIDVIIKGFTSPRARSEYNLNLGKRRISSVRNQFDTFADAALLPFIQSGQLKVLETSFGETVARSGISDDLKDERNSIYHPDAARERRVEIVEIREKE